jgi:hypothetical protein
MRYHYTPPVAAKHEVVWDADTHRGLHEAERPIFTSLKLIEPLRAWLDAHAPGWRFHSDGAMHDDQETCTLTVADGEQGRGFLEIATRLSQEWTAADRERMAHRFTMTMPGRDPIEIARSHSHIDPTYHIDTIRRHVSIDRQPWRLEFFRAARKAHGLMIDSTGPMEIDIELPEGSTKVEGTRLTLSRVGEPSS